MVTVSSRVMMFFVAQHISRWEHCTTAILGCCDCQQSLGCCCRASCSFRWVEQWWLPGWWSEIITNCSVLYCIPLWCRIYPHTHALAYQSSSYSPTLVEVQAFMSSFHFLPWVNLLLVCNLPV